MARLIDADALNEELQKRIGSPTDDKLYEVNLCIIDAPTIHAIPLGWIARQADIAEELHDKYNMYAYRRLIALWHKEQEANQ